MARYAEFSAQNMAEIISWTKAFLQTGGWTLSDESSNTTYNRTVWTATKNGAGHRFCAVYSGKFPFAATYADGYGHMKWEADSASGNYGWYTAAFGLRNIIYDGGDYFFIAPGITFPCRVFAFEMSDQSLLLSFEVETGRWQNLFSGFANKSLTGAWDGGMVMTGAASPSRSWIGIEDDGFMQPNSNTGNSCSPAPMTSLFTHNGKFIYSSLQDSSYNSTLPWPSGSFTVYGASSDNYYFITKRKYAGSLWSGSHVSASLEGLLINSIGQTKLVGLPTLFPMTIRFNNIFGAYLSDMWVCPMQTCQPGEELWMGVQKYITLPVWKYDPTSLGFAVRVN